MTVRCALLKYALPSADFCSAVQSLPRKRQKLYGGKFLPANRRDCLVIGAYGIAKKILTKAV